MTLAFSSLQLPQSFFSQPSWGSCSSFSPSDHPSPSAESGHRNNYRDPYTTWVLAANTLAVENPSITLDSPATLLP